MPLTLADVPTLACPACNRPMEFRVAGRGDRTVAGVPAAAEAAIVLDEGTLVCTGCGRGWPVRGGIPRLCDETRVGGHDRMLRLIYDVIAPVHDLGVEVVLRVLQFPDFGASRERYIRQLELATLRPRRDGAPLRILEVGIGPGANIPLVERALPRGLDVELWGLDLSTGMLRQCARWLPRHAQRPVRLLLADAHALPFADATFDRVFHVGGINGYHDPGRGLAEMARVARPDTPIVVVDEELDPQGSHWLLHRLAFAALTFLDPGPHAPRELVPTGSYEVVVTPVSRFYYCLRFRVASRDADAGQARPTAKQREAAATEDGPR